jgi:uncharacterized Zn ribbon protein
MARTDGDSVQPIKDLKTKGTSYIFVVRTLIGYNAKKIEALLLPAELLKKV